MNKENAVIFKGIQGGIAILLDQDLDFAALKECFEKKVAEAVQFFGDATASIQFKGRVLSEKEETELIHILKETSMLNITYIHGLEEKKKKQSNSKLIQETMEIQRGSIRSGQRIITENSIIVMGDVNPGGEVVAGGNIIVLGSLRGLAHAGYKGQLDAFISAVDMRPSQLRIGNIFTGYPGVHSKDINPEYAYVMDNNIYIAPIVK